jgi:hypothetical protein
MTTSKNKIGGWVDKQANEVPTGVVGWDVARRGGWATLGDNMCLERNKSKVKISADTRAPSSTHKEPRRVWAEVFLDRNGSY